MKIRKKIFLIFFGIFLLIFLTLAYISFFIILGSFNRLESEKINDDISLIERTFGQEIEALNLSCGDWAPWDDIYNYINGNNESFIENNFSLETLENLRVNSMLIYDSDRKLLYSMTVDDGAIIDPPRNIIKFIDANNLFISNGDEEIPTKGLIKVDGAPIMVSSWPISKTSREDISGRLIMLRFLNESEVSFIESLLGKKINIYNSISEIADKENIDSAVLADQKRLIAPKNNSEISSYLVLDDINNKELLVIEHKSPRSIYQQGRQSILIFIFSLLVVLPFIGLVTLLALNKIVLFRILKLNNELVDIEKKKDFSKRLEVEGGDEIAQVQSNINSTLEVLEKSLKNIKESEQKLVEKSKSLTAANKELEKTLEDFYTMRLAMESDVKKGVLEEENKKIKEKIDILKGSSAG